MSIGGEVWNQKTHAATILRVAEISGFYTLDDVVKDYFLRVFGIQGFKRFRRIRGFMGCGSFIFYDQQNVADTVWIQFQKNALPF